MAASVTLDQTRTVEAGNIYRVVTTTTAAVEMEKEVFVFAQSTDKFVNVASVFDLVNFPIGNNPSFTFYRAASVIQDLLSPVEGQIVADTHKEEINNLIDDVNAGALTFVGSEVGTVLTGNP